MFFLLLSSVRLAPDGSAAADEWRCHAIPLDAGAATPRDVVAIVVGVVKLPLSDGLAKTRRTSRRCELGGPDRHRRPVKVVRVATRVAPLAGRTGHRPQCRPRLETEPMAHLPR